MNKFLLSFLLFVSVQFSGSQALADRLVFFHSPGCVYCEMWRADIGGIYSKTEEGKRLPLREVNVHEPLPLDLKQINLPGFTPTFVVLDDDNQEIGRILGYNTEYFWGFLDGFIQKLDLAASLPSVKK